MGSDFLFETGMRDAVVRFYQILYPTCNNHT